MFIAFSPISGPDCGRSHSVLSRVVVGRAASSNIRIGDPDLSPHHLMLDSSGDAQPLGSLTESRFGGEQHLRAGSSRFLVAPVAPETERATGTLVVRRPPRPVIPALEVEPIEEPVATGQSMGLMMSTVALAGSVVIAILTGSWMFLAFGAMGVVSTGSVVLIERIRRVRRLRHQRRAHTELDRAAERDRRSLWPIDLVARAGSVRLWEYRRVADVDLVLGVVDLDGLHGAPYTCRCGPGRVLALRGERAVTESALRSIVAQLLVSVGPADLDVRVGEQLLDALPGVGHRIRDSIDSRTTVVLTAEPEQLIHADSPVRQLLDGGHDTICICLIGVGGAIPAVCTDVIEIGNDWTALIDGRDGIGSVDAIGMCVPTWSAVIDQLVDLCDPEDPDQHRRRIPTEVELTAVGRDGVGLDSAVAVLGAGADGPVTVDLVADGPHALIAGTTGSGKSELLRTLVSSLCLRHDPDTLNFLLIDHKGGAAFDALAALPQVVGVVTDLDGGLVDRVLTSLEAEVRRREVLLRVAGVTDLADLDPGGSSPARLVIIVDEFAALAAGAPDALTSLVDIARRGRSLGMHLILATQRPAGVVDEAVKANTNIRIALRLHDRADSLDVIGDERAASLDRRSPGRAMLRVGSDDPVEFQSAITRRAPVAECSQRVADRDLHPPHRPWADPLPTVISDGLGLLDACDEQRLRPLEWDPAEGNLALVGALGSGTTTALVGLAVNSIDAQIYVLDGRGDPRLAALADAGVAAPVIPLRDRERVTRLFRQVAVEVDARRGLGVQASPLLLMIDGIAEALRALDPSALNDFDTIIEEGPAVGVVTVTAGGPVHRDLQAAVWLFHLDDPGEGQRYGVRSEMVVPKIPGRFCDLRIRTKPVVGQIGMSEVDVSRRRVIPPPIGVLPEVVSGVGGIRSGRSVWLHCGQMFDDLDEARLELPDGEHLLVVGPARSGRSTALNTLAAAWATATGGHVTWVRRGNRLADVPTLPGSHLVVVDDAAMVEDDDGSFTSRLERGEPGLTVFAAGHGDSLRSRFGHWTGILRRSRRGVVLSAAGEGDGDLLGAALPIRPPRAARPGLGWICVDGSASLAQIATCEPVLAAAMLEG